MAISNSDGSIILTTKVDTSGVSRALESLKTKFASLREQKAAIRELTSAIKDQQYVIKQLELEYNILVAKGQGNSVQASELRTRITALRGELTQLNGAATALGIEGVSAFNETGAAAKRFGKRIAGIIKSALIFSVIYKVLQSVVKLFKGILMSNEEFKQDWEELKAAFYTAAYPIINLIVPAIRWIVSQVRDWAVSIGKVAAALQGISYSELVEQAKVSKEAADNYEDMEKSSKNTAKNIKKQLASFDEIQTLSSDDEDSSSGYDDFENLKKYDTTREKTMLGDLMTAISSALMAVGLILLLNGQIAWGIGFIIAGAVGIAAAMLTDESVSQKVKDELSNALLIVGVIAIVLGILLCMAQQWGLGIGAIVIGVSSIVAPIALNWNGIKEKLQTSFGAWLAVGGIIAIVLGVLLCFAQVWGLGLGLIALGVAAIVAPIVANWDAIIDLLSRAWDAVKQFWNRYIAPVFTAKWWADLGKKAINGLLGVIEKGINWIIDKINEFVGGISSITGAIGDLIGADWSIPKIPRVSIPRLAQGGVIPPNREFLAVLGDQKHGTNIEAPLDTIKQAVAEVLAQVNVGSSGFNGKIEVPVIIDGREIARAVREAEGNMGTQTVFGGFANVY